jgi:hypothetical protein
MSVIATVIQHELANLKPEEIASAVKPAAENLLKSVGSQDLDHDGQPDFQEALAAAKEIEDGILKFGRLAQAYRAKYVK